MEEKQISEHEGLLLIQQMIQTAKKEQKDDGKGWIIWGWMLFLASILTVMNINFKWFQTFFFWNFFGVITLVALAYQTVSYLFIRKTEKVRTYTKDLFQRLNTGFFISLMFIIVAINVNISPTIGFSLLISLYAFWILIYGSALNFRPSIIAAYLTWGIGFVSLFMKGFEQVMLLHAAAVLVGYIIPGHIANNEFRKLHQRNKVVESV
ncbi:hypothetical protein [Flavisolibacter ginsengisoli]|jgi:hypothetical protein|uniref:Uncharacterized protein n=1 Tax=Flavisolibacter ginsengisoli DSM 18119 TaxID=1121884 RepID=A0A1M5DG65_9BACT|nr:hypothetical protein [Flavisolibacter ginsengisoli]SHF65957.1 hypothetical protein SAMN02745131_03210 [Flavisolibacter ginsengisoli DSM 18119]